MPSISPIVFLFLLDNYFKTLTKFFFYRVSLENTALI